MKKAIPLLIAAGILLATVCILSLNSGDKKTAVASNPWDIAEAKTGKQQCGVSVAKNMGGQETGLSCIIYIPLEPDADKTAVPLELTLADGAIVAPESLCIKSLDKNKLVIDLTADPLPSITIENKGYSRTYRLMVVPA